MGSFSVWHWLVIFLPLALLGALLWFTSRRSLLAPRIQGQLSGFGGWLLLVAIGQTIAPFKIAVNALTSLDGLATFSRLPNGIAVVYADVGATFLLAAFYFYVTVTMWRRLDSFPILFTWQWGITVVFVLFEPPFFAVTLGLSIGEIYSNPLVISGITQAFASGLWVWYVMKSARVRNTFRKAPLFRSRSDQRIEPSIN